MWECMLSPMPVSVKYSHCDSLPSQPKLQLLLEWNQICHIKILTDRKPGVSQIPTHTQKKWFLQCENLGEDIRLERRAVNLEDFKVEMIDSES